MIEQALRYQFERGAEDAKGKQARIFQIPGNDGRTVVIEHDGQLIDRDVPPPLRKHSVDTVQGLIDATSQWGSETGTIWIRNECVVLVIDDGDRRETVSLPLRVSDLFHTLQRLAGGESKLDQLQFVRFLRRDFRHAPQAATLLHAVRKLKFRTHQSGHSDITHGNESMGNEIESQVTGAAEIADFLTVPVSVFKNAGEDRVTFEVTLDIEIDAKNAKFIVKPMPDEIDAAIANALDSIKERIEKGIGEKVPVFFGTP